jgi:hypothetical protein
MRKLLLTVFLTLSFLSLFLPVDAATTPTINSTTPVQLVLDKLASLSVRDAQQLAGRKFTLKEKLGFWILKQQIKKGQKKGFSKTLIYKSLKKTVGKKDKQKADEPGSKGQSALVFGIGAIVLLVLGLFIPYVIIASFISAILAIVLGTIAKKQDKSDVKGGIGKLLGWITLGLIAALVILVIATLNAIFN